MTKQIITKRVTQFGNGHYVLIPRFVMMDWAEKLKTKLIKAVQLITHAEYLEIRPLKEK